MTHLIGTSTLSVAYLANRTAHHQNLIVHRNPFSHSQKYLTLPGCDVEVVEVEQSLEQPLGCPHRAVVQDQVVEAHRRECQQKEGPGSM